MSLRVSDATDAVISIRIRQMNVRDHHCAATAKALTSQTSAGPGLRRKKVLRLTNHPCQSNRGWRSGGMMLQCPSTRFSLLLIATMMNSNDNSFTDSFNYCRFSFESQNLDRRLYFIIDQINMASKNLCLADLQLWMEKENPEIVAVSEPTYYLRRNQFSSFNHHWIRCPGVSESLCGFFIRRDVSFEVLHPPRASDRALASQFKPATDPSHWLLSMCNTPLLHG